MSLNYSVLLGRAKRGGHALGDDALSADHYTALKGAADRGELPAARPPGFFGRLAEIAGPILATGGIASLAPAGRPTSGTTQRFPGTTPPFNPSAPNSGAPSFPQPGGPSGIPPISGAGGRGINWDMILGLAGMYDIAKQRSNATDLENQGLNRLRGAYDSKQGLRDMGLAGMTMPEPDSRSRLSSVYARDTGNPYDAGPVIGGAPGAPPPVAPVTPRPRERDDPPPVRPPARPRY